MIYLLHRDSWISKIYQGFQSKYLKHIERFSESPKYSNVVWNPIKVFKNIVLTALPNPEKSRDLVFKNPGIGIWVQSRDPIISQDPAGAWSPLRMIMTTTVMIIMTMMMMMIVVVVAECQRHKAKGQGSKGPFNLKYPIKEKSDIKH